MLKWEKKKKSFFFYICIVDRYGVFQLRCGLMSYCGALTSIHSIILRQRSVPVPNTWVILEFHLFMSKCCLYLYTNIYSSFTFSSSLHSSYYHHRLCFYGREGRMKAESWEKEKAREEKWKYSLPPTVKVSWGGGICQGLLHGLWISKSKSLYLLSAQPWGDPTVNDSSVWQ